MNKCSKCGAEFEGNFCPECGTPSQAPKVCPKCGAQLKENVKFCNNCGYAFVEQNDAHSADKSAQQGDLRSSAPAKSTTTIDWQQSKVFRLLQYAPLVIFALWAVLLWAFMAAPVMKGEPPVMPNVSVYGFFNAETVEGDPDLAAITPAAGAMVAVSAVALLYAGYLVYLQFKGGRVARWLAHYFSVLPYVLVLVCTSVIAVKFNAYAEGMDDMKGSFVGVTVALTVVFLLLHAASLVLCKLFKISVITQEDREQAKQRFEAWCVRRRHRREYRKQRRPIVAQRLKKEPFIRGRSCGAMCILALIFICAGIGLAFPSKEAISYYTDYDAYFEKEFYSWIYEEQFDYLKNAWEEVLPSRLEYRYEDAQEYHGKYEKDKNAQNNGVKFEEWLNDSIKYLRLDLYLGYVWDEAFNDWQENKAYVSTAELYELGVDGYIAQRYPDGFGDFVEEVAGTNSTTKESYVQNSKQLEYDSQKQDWSPATQELISCILMMFLPALVAAVFAIVACVLAFRRKWRASAVFGWILVILSFAAFLLMLLTGAAGLSSIDLYYIVDGRYTLLIVASGGMLPAAMLFSLVNVFIQGDDERKARKRFKREYDEQMAEQGDESALWFVAHKKDRKRKRSKSTADANGN